MRPHFSILMLTLMAAGVQSPARSIEGSTPDSCAIWGQVVIPGRSLQEPTLIELVAMDGESSQKMVVNEGNFRFKSVPPGRYQIRVSDQEGRVIYKEIKAIHGTNERITISLLQPRWLSGSNTISIGELKHETPRKARDEFKTARKATENGNTQTSVEHLLKALEIDPQFPEARINLAVQYGRMERYQEALEQGRRAFEINPGIPDVGYGYALILLATKNYRECETVARCMIRNQYYTAEMKAALAVSLIGQRRDFNEALGYLQQAATEFPLARLLAANTLVEVGWRAAALNQVRTYLDSSANPCERAQLETWIANHSQPSGITVESSH